MGVTRDMKDREIRGERVLLVPYKERHVLKYHSWMKDPDLLFLTGSEPLTLEQEYEMQRKWTLDDDKCTFIVLNAAVLEETKDEVAAMIGDTNIFFADPNDLSTGEIELMIAESDHRNKGLGKEVLQLMMAFCREVVGVRSFVAKIKDTNAASMHLFEKLGFRLVSESAVFQEKTLQLDFQQENNS